MPSPSDKPLPQVAVAHERPGGLVIYTTAYTEEQVVEALESCRVRYGSAVILKEKPA